MILDFIIIIHKYILIYLKKLNKPYRQKVLCHDFYTP